MTAVYVCFPRVHTLQMSLAWFFVYHLPFARSVTHNVFAYVKLSVVLNFKFKRLSRKNGFLISGIRKCPTVHRCGQDEKNLRSTQCNESGSTYCIKGLHSAPMPAVCKKLKVCALHRCQQYVRNWRSVQCTDAGRMRRITGLHSAPSQAVCTKLKVSTLHRCQQYVRN